MTNGKRESLRIAAYEYESFQSVACSVPLIYFSSPVRCNHRFHAVLRILRSRSSRLATDFIRDLSVLVLDLVLCDRLTCHHFFLRESHSIESRRPQRLLIVLIWIFGAVGWCGIEHVFWNRLPDNICWTEAAVDPFRNSCIFGGGSINIDVRRVKK